MEGYEKISADKYRVYVSALIKSMRRGLVDDAIYWSAVLWKLDRAAEAWQRILIHCSEDVGPAEPNLPANIRALYENWKELMSVGHVDGARLFYVHAVILMAKAKKSRIVDNAAIYYYTKPLEDRPVPDYAFDHHGRVGREMGRGMEYFFDVASQLNPVSDDPSLHPDPYFELAKKTAIDNERNK